MRVGDLAPRVAGAGALERALRLVDGVRQPPAVALERQVRRLELERGPQLIEPADVLRAQQGDARAAVGSIRTMPSAASARSAARSVCRATP